MGEEISSGLSDPLFQKADIKKPPENIGRLFYYLTLMPAFYQASSIGRLGSRAGTNTSVANNVHPKESNSNRPILAVPGW